MKKLLLILSIITTTATAQEISYGEYMQRVMDGNIALTAKRLDIDIADAHIKSSKVYNDPTVAVTYTNNEDWSKKLGQGIEVELSRTFTFGVRKNRMQMADNERKLTIALFEEYMRNFRADATLAYLEHLRAGMLLAEAREILHDLEEIASNDSMRFSRGYIAESGWLESRMAMGKATVAAVSMRSTPSVPNFMEPPFSASATKVYSPPEISTLVGVTSPLTVTTPSPLVEKYTFCPAGVPASARQPLSELSDHTIPSPSVSPSHTQLLKKLRRKII